MRRLVPSTLAASLLALAGCVSGEAERAELPPVGPQGVEGRWASVGGEVAYNVVLQNGQFSSLESQTGAVLANGTYSNLGPGQISIVYRPTTRNTEVAANCNQVDVNRLACATSTGSRFELARA